MAFFPTLKAKCILLKSKVIPLRGEEDNFSLFAVLEMGPYPFEHVAANGHSGSECALEEDQGEETLRLIDTTWHVHES